VQAFRGKKLPKYTYEQIAHPSRKPSVDYDAKFLSLGKENAAAVKVFQEEIEKIFSESEVFSKFSAGIGSEEYHLTLVLRNEGNLGLAFLSGFISGLTFTIIPGYAKDEYILTVDVKRGDQVLKRYQYKHYMDTWIQLFLIFLTPTHSPEKVSREVMDDLLLNFLYDLGKDKILEVPLNSH